MQTIHLDSTTPIKYHSNLRTFTVEVSSLPDNRTGVWVTLVNSAGKRIEFKFDKHDRNREGEIEGSRYIATKGHKFPVSLLIIND